MKLVRLTKPVSCEPVSDTYDSIKRQGVFLLVPELKASPL